MIDVIRSQGISDKAKTAHANQSVWERLEKCQPIVFSKQVRNYEELDVNTFDPHDSESSLSDAPFPTFSIEMLDGPIVGPPDDVPNRFYVWCIVGIEFKPNKFAFLELLETADTSKPEWTVALVVCSAYAKPLIERLRREKTGVESVRQRLEIGTGNEKRVAKIRRIIHVCPKAQTSKYAEGTGREIDWSHRWLVRGHWRALPGRLGKDREGRYCVKDWTWTKDHEKGPEGLPLIAPKTRVVAATRRLELQ